MVDVARLEQVISLLEQIIERKRKYAQDLRDDTFTSMSESVANLATASYIDVNVGELDLIAKDLRSCILK